MHTCKLIKTQKCEQCCSCEFLAQVLLESTPVCLPTPPSLFFNTACASVLFFWISLPECHLSLPSMSENSVLWLIWGNDKGAYKSCSPSAIPSCSNPRCMWPGGTNAVVAEISPMASTWQYYSTSLVNIALHWMCHKTKEAIFPVFQDRKASYLREQP